VEVDSGSASAQFLTGPRCRREYTRLPGVPLTSRWGDPLSLALYSVIFEQRPADVDMNFIDRQLPAFPGLEAAVLEIGLELEQPTQRVKDILDCVATEAELRRTRTSVSGRQG
jgi:hypothetical protein